MKLADRYAGWLDVGRICESSPLRVARTISELELQARWFAGEFGHDFVTTAGEPVSILEFGAWNREAGPRFRDALVSFGGGLPVRGGIEVGNDARERHCHVESSDFEGTILHLFATAGCGCNGGMRTKAAGGREIPQVRLDTSPFEFGQTDPLKESDVNRCGAPLTFLPQQRMEELLEVAAQFRLCRKSARLKRQSNPDESLYQALAETLGYQHNKLPFMLLAQRFPLSQVLRQRDQVEPLLFGGSGFLSDTDLGSMAVDTRGYLQGVWEQWWPLRSEYANLILPRELWTLKGVRPVNHPQRRVAALAEIIRNWSAIQTLAHRCEVGAIRGFFSRLTHEYWDCHYTLTSRRSATRMALVGEARVNAMLANVFFPAAIAVTPQCWHSYRELPASDSNQRVELASQRLLGSSPIARKLLKRTVFQQGLLQVQEDHCGECDGNGACCPLRKKLEKCPA